jgi:hypothetical protein
MATTTNYSWTTPDDTALVKDGAAAIRTLGSSVDTTVKNLNPETTLGDIAYRSSTANVKTRLGLGTAGQVLTVNSGATAPEWKTITAGGLTLISTTVISNALTTTISSIPSTYKSLRIVVANYIPVNDGVGGVMRFNTDLNVNRHKSLTGWGASSGSFDAQHFTVFNGNDNSVSNSLTIIDVPDYSNTTTWKMAQITCLNTNSTTTTNYNFDTYFGFYNQTAAINAVSFVASTGNISSATIYLYGVQ